MGEAANKGEIRQDDSNDHVQTAQIGTGTLPASLLPPDTECGLATLRVSAALFEGIDPALGDGAHMALCLDVCGSAVQSYEKQRNPMDVVLIIDTSGSMGGVIKQVQETCLQVFTALQPKDRISLVSFSTGAKVILSMSTKESTDNFFELCERIQAGGGTNIESGLRMGIEQFAEAHNSNNTALAIILSDGSPNGGEGHTDALCGIAASAAMQSGRGVTIHSLGFTQHHRVELMSSLPQASNGPAGSYYYLGTESDMPAAVGDCLGSGSVSRPCRALHVACEAFPSDDHAAGECHWYGPAANEARNEMALLGLQPPAALKVAALQASERQVAVFILPETASGAIMHVSWESDSGPQSFSARLQCKSSAVAQNNISLSALPSSMSIEELGVVAHVLRLQVAAALTALAMNPNIGDRYDSLHNAVLQCMAVLQTISEESNGDVEEEAVFLEGMLQALERDLGEALSSRDQGPERRGVLLSFAAEHFAMRSASSLTRVRTAYATREQVLMRLRFLQSSAGADGLAAKEACKIDETGLSDEEMQCRKAVEDHACYVTLSPWRETVLGLGLFVHPRTCRERRAGMPAQIDLVVDYVSAEAYNLGVRTTVQHSATEGRAIDSGDGDELEMPQEILQSSARRRINAWLPIHINAANWAVAKTFAPSAFSLIATQLNTVFRPEDALRVCARLMCCTVVGFVRSDDGLIERTGASERAVQMYCDVHRLFLKMAEDYPVIKKLALQHVESFIRDPEVRTRKKTPDLGLLITYLSILDEVSWNVLCDVFVPEMVRRAFGRMREPFGEHSCNSKSDIIARFDMLEPEHGRVILFFKVFNSLVARPSAPWSEPMKACEHTLPVAEVCDMYDRRWGCLPPERCHAVLSEIKRMCGITSVSTVLQELLPFEFAEDEVCELILWATKHGHNKKTIQQWLSLRKMPKNLTQEWQRSREMQIKFKKDAQEILCVESTIPHCLDRLLSMTKIFWEQHLATVRAPPQEPRYTSREEACLAAAEARERAEKRKAAKGKGNCKGQCKGQGKNVGLGKCQSNVYNKVRNRSVNDSSESEDDEGHANNVITEDDEGHANNAIDCTENRDFDVSARGPFHLQVRILPDMTGSGKDQTISVSVVYKSSSEAFTNGCDLRAQIAAATGLDARKMRLVVRGAKAWTGWTVVEKKSKQRAEQMDSETTEIPLSNSAVLAKWELEARDVVVEVQKKQRGGKKPGNGWHAYRNHGRTYQMCIASAIARDTVFSRVEQYLTVVEDGNVLDVLLGLSHIFAMNATVVCGGGNRFLKHEALARGLEVEQATSDCVLQINTGLFKLVLLTEVDAGEPSGSTMYYSENESEPELPEPVPVHMLADYNRYGGKGGGAGALRGTDSKGCKDGKGGKGSKGGKGNEGKCSGGGLEEDDGIVPATVVIPPEARDTGLIIVTDGHMLRETGTLSKAILGVCGAERQRGKPTPLFHLATDIRQVFLESEEQIQSIAANVSSDGCVNNTIELPGQPCVPSGAILVPAHTEQASPPLPDASQLPCALQFRLRMPSLGLVTRMRDRYGCNVSEIFHDVLCSLLSKSRPLK